MEIQLRSLQTKQPPADTDVGNEVNNLQAQLRLEILMVRMTIVMMKVMKPVSNNN